MVCTAFLATRELLNGFQFHERLASFQFCALITSTVRITITQEHTQVKYYARDLDEGETLLHES